jgi:hypothetical protein
VSTELAWAAGFFDGEGSTLYTSTQKGRYHLRVMVWQKDQRPLHRFQAALELGSIYGPYIKQKDMSVWVVSCAKAEEALEKLWPYLSEPKREQAISALERWYNRPLKIKTADVSRRGIFV